MTFDSITTRHVFRFFALFVIGFVSFTEIGYQALLSILVDEGVFNSYCAKNNGDECNTQSVILSFMFEAAVSMLNISSFFWGCLCLKYNRRNLMAIGSILSIITCILFAFGNDWIRFFCFIFLSNLCSIFPLTDKNVYNLFITNYVKLARLE